MIQKLLESHLHFLRNLLQYDLFSKSEIRILSEKRRKLLLATENGSQLDWIKLIDWEKNVEKIWRERVRKSRKIWRDQQKQKENKKGKGKGNQSLGPPSAHSNFLPSYILTLHRLATRHFPSSLPLITSHFDYLLSVPSPSLSSLRSLLRKLILLRPNESRWWLELVRLEIWGVKVNMIRDGKKVNEQLGGGNWEQGRKIIMKSLRFLRNTKHEDQVWVEWIKIECCLADKVGRREEIILGGDSVKSSIAEGQVVKKVLEGMIDCKLPYDPSHIKLTLISLQL
jgi:hypothetical protein